MNKICIVCGKVIEGDGEPGPSHGACRKPYLLERGIRIQAAITRVNTYGAKELGRLKTARENLAKGVIMDTAQRLNLSIGEIRVSQWKETCDNVPFSIEAWAVAEVLGWL